METDHAGPIALRLHAAQYHAAVRDLQRVLGELTPDSQEWRAAFERENILRLALMDALGFSVLPCRSGVGQIEEGGEMRKHGGRGG